MSSNYSIDLVVGKCKSVHSKLPVNHLRVIAETKPLFWIVVVGLTLWFTHESWTVPLTMTETMWTLWPLLICVYWQFHGSGPLK